MLNITQKSSPEKRIVLDALLFVVVSRLLVYLVYRYYMVNTGWTEGFLSSMYRWDAPWYGDIAQYGYGWPGAIHGDGQAYWAFFPLVPMAERILLRLGVPLMMTGPLFNTVALYFLNVFGASFVEETYGTREHALLFMFILDFGPYNVYYSTMYTEAFFSLAVCMFLRSMYKQRWLQMGLWGALASATRNTGVFLVFVIFAYSIQLYLQRQKRTESRRSIGGYIGWVLREPKLLLGVSLIPLGLFTFMAYLGYVLDDPLAFTHVQVYWGFIGDPLKVVQAALSDLGYYEFYMLLWVVLGTYLFLSQVRRRRVESIITAITVFVPLAARINSMSRYIMCLFTVVLELTCRMKESRRMEKAFLVVVFFILGLATTYGWVACAGFMT